MIVSAVAARLIAFVIVLNGLLDDVPVFPSSPVPTLTYHVVGAAAVVVAVVVVPNDEKVFVAEYVARA
jgi:hypothetical protein